MNRTVKLLTQQLAEAEAAREEMLEAQRSAQDRLAQAQRKAEQLTLYRQEYENGWGAAARSSNDARLLAEHPPFIDRLCREIDTQLALCKTAAAALVSTRAALRSRESRLVSIHAAIARQGQLARQQEHAAQPAAGADAALARFKQTLFALTTSDMPFGLVPA